MLLLSWLLSLLVGGDVRRLGSEDYATRERATARLASVGLLARPNLRAAMESYDPEVRARASLLLARQDVKLRPYRVPLIVSGLVDVPRSWWDVDTRRRLWVFVQASGVETYYPPGHPHEWAQFAPWRINPQWDYYLSRDGVYRDPVPYWDAAMGNVREQLAARRR